MYYLVVYFLSYNLVLICVSVYEYFPSLLKKNSTLQIVPRSIRLLRNQLKTYKNVTSTPEFWDHLSLLIFRYNISIDSNDVTVIFLKKNDVLNCFKKIKKFHFLCGNSLNGWFFINWMIFLLNMWPLIFYVESGLFYVSKIFQYARY